MAACQVKLAGPAPHLLETSPEECQRMADLAAEFSEQDLMRFLDILLNLHQQMRHASEARFTLALGLLKLVEAERLAGVKPSDMDALVAAIIYGPLK